ncbi:hypothetical protein M569_08663, partial [Genlisea aurea]
SLFRYFDAGNHWNAESGIAFPILRDIQILMDDFGQNTHFLLLILIKHLDHKNLIKQPDMQLHIVQVITSLARHSNLKGSVAIVGAIIDMIKFLHKSIHCSIDDADIGSGLINWKNKIHEVVDESLRELSLKVGDAGMILDAMSNILESIPNVTSVARTTIYALVRMSEIVAYMPNLLYRSKAIRTFPEALFHQILGVMRHPDHEIRIGAHQIFSAVLLPSPVSHATSDCGENRGIIRTTSLFSSSAALFEKLRYQNN